MHATTIHFHTHRRAVSTLAICLMTASGLARAHTFCVSTSTALQNALTASSEGGIYNGETNFIGVVQGTYPTGSATGNGAFHYASSTGSLTVLGGYDALCNSSTGKAAQTVLDGLHNTPVLSLRNSNGPLQVYYLTLQNGESGAPGAGLEMNYLTTVSNSFRVSASIIRNNHSSGDGGGLYASGAGNVDQIDRNLISGNSADGQYGAGYITGYGIFNEVFNNTVVKNTANAASNPVGGLNCGGTSKCFIDNNIFWNNTNCGLSLGNAAALSYNDYGTRCGVAPAGESGRLSLSPNFVNESGGDFHLNGASPLLGYGPPQGPMNDLDGYAYPVTGKIDLGAYEETIFIDGLDGN